MANKIKTLTLSYPHYDNSKHGGTERYNAPRVYQVEKITDSVEYSPYQQLSKRQVDELCDASNWKVTVIPATKK